MNEPHEGMCIAPPSTNALFANVGKSRIKTTKYKNWQAQAGLELRQRSEPFDCPVGVVIKVGKCNQARDLDNFNKPILDLLVALGWVKDDNLNHVHFVNVRRDFGVTPDGCVRVMVAPTREATQ